MLKAVAGALVGIAIIILGVYVWYMYILSLEKGGNHFLFALSLIQIGIGIYVLFWASKNSDPFHLQSEKIVQTEVKQKDFGELLKRNNEIVQQYNKTADFRDQLKIMQVAAEEAEKATH